MDNNTYVEFKVYIESDFSAKIMVPFVVIEGEEVALDIQSGVQGAMEVKYVVLNLGGLKEESRLFERRINIISQKIQDEVPGVISVAFRTLSFSEIESMKPE